MMKKVLFILTFLCISVLMYGQPEGVVNVGTTANSGDGDALRDAFIKVNARFVADGDSIADLREEIESIKATPVISLPGNGIDIISNTVQMGDTISSSITQKLLADRLYSMTSSGEGSFPISSSYYFKYDSISWRVFNPNELNSNSFGISSTGITGKYLGTDVFKLNSQGIVLQHDSVRFPELAESSDGVMTLRSSGTVRVDAIESGRAGLTMKLRPAIKQLYDRESGEIKLYYLDDDGVLTHRYGLYPNIAKALYQVQVQGEVNLRYIVRLQFLTYTLSLIILLLVVYIKVKK